MYSVITILKGFHLRFRSFLTMESALVDPLENMKKEEWRFLCEKWSNKDYKVRCAKNKLNYEKLKVFHTAGSKAFRKVQYDEVNEVGSVTKSIEAMKISKRAGSSIADLPTGLDTAPILELPW